MDHMETPPPRRRGARQRISNHFYSNNDRFVPNGFGTLASNVDVSNFDIGEWNPQIDDSDRTALISDMNFDVGVFDPRTDISEQQRIQKEEEVRK